MEFEITLSCGCRIQAEGQGPFEDNFQTLKPTAVVWCEKHCSQQPFRVEIVCPQCENSDPDKFSEILYDDKVSLCAYECDVCSTGIDITYYLPPDCDNQEE